MASILIAIDGSTKRLAVMNPTAKSAILEGILGKIFPEAASIPSNITAPNFIPNVEELAATNPDLLIQLAGRGSDYVDPITNAGLTAMLIAYGSETQGPEYMTMAATAINKPERIGALIDWCAKVEADIAAPTAAIPESDCPRVLYLLRAQETLRAGGTKGNYNALLH